MTEQDPAPAYDAAALVELLEAFFLGEVPSMTGPQVAERSGITLDLAKERWRSLGFQTVPDDEVAFTELDLRAMELTHRLHQLGLVGDDEESALVRTLGRSFARLAEWQLALVGRHIDPRTTSVEDAAELLGTTTPLMEETMNYVWRRHLLGAATRALLAPEAAEGDSVCVGFADIVGYTRQSRSLRQEEIGRLVEDFEAAAQAVVAEHGGRIIKSIGDEVLFVTEEPLHAAYIGLKLVNAHDADERFPELRVGMARGHVLSRLGDVYGPVVNVAARLTSLARPGKVLVDVELAEALGAHEQFRLRRTRRTSVKGYRRLEPWSLKLQQGHGLFDVVDEVHPLTHVAPGPEGAQ